MSNKVPLLVPRRDGDERRDRIWSLIRPWWEYHGLEVVEGHHDEGLFSRSAAINKAARDAGDWSVALIADSDIILDDISQAAGAVNYAQNTGVFSYGHNWMNMVNKEGTEIVLKELEKRRYDWKRLNDRVHIREGCIMQAVPNTWSSCIAVRRDLWDEMSGMDERFQGWGCEDWALRSTGITLSGDCWRPAHRPSIVFHMWHDRERKNEEEQPVYVANEKLGRRYLAAMGDRQEIRKLLEQKRLDKELP